MFEFVFVVVFVIIIVFVHVCVYNCMCIRIRICIYNQIYNCKFICCFHPLPSQLFHPLVFLSVLFICRSPPLSFSCPRPLPRRIYIVLIIIHKSSIF